MSIEVILAVCINAANNASAVKAAEAIAKKNNLNLNKGFSYLISHGKLDLSHVEFYKKLVNQVEDINLQKIIIERVDF